MARRPDFCRKLLKIMETITILIMIAIFFVGMSSNLSINKTLDVYSHKNIFTKKLTFIDRFSKNNDENDEDEEPMSIINKTKVNLLHRMGENLKNTLQSQFSNKTYANNQTIKSENATNNQTEEEIIDRIHDDLFIEQMEVGLYDINSMKTSLQEYLVFYPLITLIVATSWGALLICFRSGGYCNEEWVSIGPWRIVIPSIVCFSVMCVASAIYVYLSNKYSNRLCENLGSELKNPQYYTCGYLLEKLAPIEPFHVFPTSTQFKIYRVSIKIDLVLWFIALCIMSIRWFLAIDFELVKIALSPYCRDETKAYDSEFEEPTTITETKLTQLSEIGPDDSIQAVQLPKKNIRDSRDDLDDFQSAHSHLTGSDSNVQEFSSLEPLIQGRLSQSQKKDEDIIKTESV